MITRPMPDAGRLSQADLEKIVDMHQRAAEDATLMMLRRAILAKIERIPERYRLEYGPDGERNENTVSQAYEMGRRDGLLSVSSLIDNPEEWRMVEPSGDVEMITRTSDGKWPTVGEVQENQGADRARIIKVGKIRRTPEGGWAVSDWHFDCENWTPGGRGRYQDGQITKTKDGGFLIAGWPIEELEAIAMGLIEPRNPDLDCGMDWTVPPNSEPTSPYIPEQNTITPDGSQRIRIVIDKKVNRTYNEKESEDELVIVIEPKKITGLERHRAECEAARREIETS
jgi:hypothetical protein